MSPIRDWLSDWRSGIWFTKYLASNERLYFLDRPHPIVQLWFVARWTALAGGVGVGVGLGRAPSTGAVVATAMFATVVVAGLLRSTISVMIVTSGRIIVVEGLVRRIAKSIALSTVAELWVDYPKYGRRLDVGDIVVRLHGRRRPGFRVPRVQEPELAYQHIRDICFGEPGESRKWSDDD